METATTPNWSRFPHLPAKALAGTAVVILAGRHANQPGVVVAESAQSVDVLLSRSGERVTVRKSSVEMYA